MRFRDHLPGIHDQKRHGTRVGHFHIEGEGDRKFYRTFSGTAVSTRVTLNPKRSKGVKSKPNGRKVRR